jgi:hypothetical protein
MITLFLIYLFHLFHCLLSLSLTVHPLAFLVLVRAPWSPIRVPAPQPGLTVPHLHDNSVPLSFIWAVASRTLTKPIWPSSGLPITYSSGLYPYASISVPHLASLTLACLLTVPSLSPVPDLVSRI